MNKEKHQELERPCKFHWKNGKRNQPKEDKLKTYRESDQLIVLGSRESLLHGEGVDSDMQLAKETLTVL